MASAWYRIKQEDGSTLWFEPGRQVVCENGSDEEQRLTPLESRILGVLVGRRQRISAARLSHLAGAKSEQAIRVGFTRLTKTLPGIGLIWKGGKAKLYADVTIIRRED